MNPFFQKFQHFPGQLNQFFKEKFENLKISLKFSKNFKLSIFIETLLYSRSSSTNPDNFPMKGITDF